MLDNLQHIIFDLGLMFRWLWEIAVAIFNAAITWPLSLFKFFSITISTMATTPITSTPIVFLDSTITILHAIPYWGVISAVVAGGFAVLLGYQIIHILKN